ncbi:MAG: SGNH/GDSL hydrolase family protein [Bryobacteraceae bacterium]|jgi:lysophospholipase L1-like esterase
MKLRVVAFLILVQLGHFTCIEAQEKGQEHWVATWTTAELLARPPAAPTAPTTAAPAPAGARGFSNQTVRMIVRTSIGGSRLRVKLSNAFGSEPLAVGAAHIGIRSKDSEIVAGSDRPLSFNGKPGCTIGPGMVILSDPVNLNVAPLSDVAVSLHFPGETGLATTHATGLHTTYIKEGDVTGQAAMADAATTQSYYWLAGIDVMAPARTSLIVAFGDSITDGARSTPETNHSWPALLAARLEAKKKTAKIAVGNMGIGGNRVLRDGAGVSALARFDRDVLSQSGVKWVMLLEGINDIGREATIPAEAVTAEELIGGYKQIIERAHTHGIKVIGCMLTPYEGANYSREKGEATREAVNTWIRTSGAFDAVVDFEAATRDPNNPKRIRADFDPGDHLHPNDAGYQAMANAVDLSIFGGKRAASRPAKRKAQ